MCGIIAALSNEPVVPLLINGLKRLEYRGYDSAGLSVVVEEGLETYKTKGKVSALDMLVSKTKGSKTERAQLGIAHTRWATHGEPTNANAHPHESNGQISVVHNGIIENFLPLKEMLRSNGYEFISDTDTEVLSHLIHYISTIEKGEDLKTIVHSALEKVSGAYGICVLDTSQEEPVLVGARNGSPLILGVSQQNKGSDIEYKYLLASDTSALVGHSEKVIYLEDGDIICCTKRGYHIENMFVSDLNSVVEREMIQLDQKLEAIQKGGYEHFMLKEILEQPQVLTDAMRGRVQRLSEPDEQGFQYSIKLSGVQNLHEEFVNCKRIIFLGCGTSYHSGLILEYLFESLCKVPVEVEYASEFRYRDPILFPESDVVIVISQSGETLDSLESLRICKKRNVKVFGLINVVGSSIARACDAGIFLRVGGEIGVASTKAFTGQLVGGMMLALDIAKRRGTADSENFNSLAESLFKVPETLKPIIAEDSLSTIREIASVFRYAQNFLYLGRGFNYPSALEGALKLKEISYIHAEGYPAAEMKHGPIALIDKQMPAIILAPKYTNSGGESDNLLYEKTVSAVEQVRARGGCVVLLTTEGNDEWDNKCEFVLKLPEVREELTPLLYAVPLQLVAYFIAKFRGCDIDQPRNLAKSVTVE
eukprot:augustus_masked-scaffold_2-processed-gene-9.15-mRNA-1 protein AED:0.05 eAED:0.05 QI:0/-1/0/1/-1/1/1/0/649